jgi:hypothetical protein
MASLLNKKQQQGQRVLSEEAIDDIKARSE